MKKIFFTGIAFSLAPMQLWAHEGHGLPGHGSSIAHYAFEPIHLPLALLASAAVLWVLVQLQGQLRHKA